MSDYIAVPLSASKNSASLFNLQSGDIEASIDNFLNLLVFTPKGTFDADPDFGFEYWRHEGTNVSLREFNNYLSYTDTAGLQSDITRIQCENSIRQSILIYEPRLKEPVVSIELIANNILRKRKAISKYEMRIQVAGYIDDGMGITRQYEKKIVFLVEPTAKVTI